MLRKIIENLEVGNYRIVPHEKCECEFNWKFDYCRKLHCHKVIENCWCGNVLIMDNLAGCRDKTLSVDREGLIATCGRSNKIEVLVDADHDVQEKIAKAIEESDAYAQLTASIGTWSNLHNRREYESLVNWLEKNVHLNLYVRFENANDDSASEYTCIMLAMPPELCEPDKLHVPRNWYAHSPEEWAKMYLCKDDAVIVRFSLIEVIYSICHCRYVEKYNAIVPSDTGEEFYAPVEYAHEVLEKLWPKGNDCYELARYYINGDNGKIELIEDVTTKWSPLIIFDCFKKAYPEIYKVDGGNREVELVLTNEPWLSFDGCYKSSATDRGGNRWLVKWEKKTDWRHAAPSYAELIEVRFYKYTEDFKDLAPTKEI